jgi:hypothetical protein
MDNSYGTKEGKTDYVFRGRVRRECLLAASEQVVWSARFPRVAGTILRLADWTLGMEYD